MSRTRPAGRKARAHHTGAGTRDGALAASEDGGATARAAAKACGATEGARPRSTNRDAPAAGRAAACWTAAASVADRLSRRPRRSSHSVEVSGARTAARRARAAAAPFGAGAASVRPAAGKPRAARTFTTRPEPSSSESRSKDTGAAAARGAEAAPAAVGAAPRADPNRADGRRKKESPGPGAAAAAPGPGLSFFRLPSALFGSARGAAPTAAGAASAPRAAAAPVSFERLSLELGSGLVVKVRAALGLPAAGRTLAAPAPNGAAAARARRAAVRAPLTSTEWLERRGLLESLSATEAAAVQQAAALPAAGASLFVDRGLAPSVAPHAFAAARAVAPPSSDAASAPSRVPAPVWWALAFLPAGLVLLKELL